MNLLPPTEKEAWIFCSVLGIILVTGFSLNITLLAYIYKIKDPRHLRLYHIFASLSLASLSTALVIIPAWIYVLICYQISREASEKFQKIHEIFYLSFDVFHGFVSFLHLLAAGAERLLALSSPITHRVSNDAYNYLISVSCWLVAVVLTSIGTVIYYFLKPEVLLLIIVSVLVFLPFVLELIICVFLGIKSVYIQNKVLLTRTQRRERRATGNVILVFAWFCITNLPFHVFIFVDFFYPQFLHTTVMLCLRCSCYSSCLFISLIQLFGLSELRNKLSWCIFKCCARNEGLNNDLYTMGVPGIQGKISGKKGSGKCDLVRHTSFYHETHPEITMTSADQCLSQTDINGYTNFSLS